MGSVLKLRPVNGQYYLRSQIARDGIKLNLSRQNIWLQKSSDFGSSYSEVPKIRVVQKKTVQEWILQYDKQYNTIVWLKYDTGDRNQVSKLRCFVSWQFQKELECMRNFSSAHFTRVLQLHVVSKGKQLPVFLYDFYGSCHIASLHVFVCSLRIIIQNIHCIKIVQVLNRCSVEIPVCCLLSTK